MMMMLLLLLLLLYEPKGELTAAWDWAAALSQALNTAGSSQNVSSSSSSMLAHEYHAAESSAAALVFLKSRKSFVCLPSTTDPV